MHRRILCLVVFVLACSLSSAVALEYAADTKPVYLEQSMLADWRLTQLHEVLLEIGQMVERPLVQEGSVAALADNNEYRVVLIETERRPLEHILKMLEASHGLYFTAEALRLRVETLGDRAERRRRLVDLQLRDYGGGLQVLKFEGADVGLSRPAYGSGGGMGLFAADDVPEISSGSLSADEMVDLLGRAASAASATVYGKSAFLRVTPEEEEAMRGALRAQVRQSLVRSSWRVSFGLIPEQKPLSATGLVPTAQLAGIRDSLQESRHLQVTGLAGQSVTAGSLKRRQRVQDADIGGHGRPDPVVNTTSSGRQVVLTSFPGLAVHRLHAELVWAEPLADRVVPVQAREIAQGSKYMSMDVNDNGDGDLSGEASIEVSEPVRMGEKVDMDLPAFWRWAPNFHSMVPKDAGLVLTAQHPKGIAVIVIERVEEVQP